MTRIEKYLKSFEAYHAGEMDPEEKTLFEKRLEKDAALKAAWEEYHAMMRAFSDKEAVSLRIKLEKAWEEQYRIGRLEHQNRLLVRIAAAAVILVVMGLLLYFFCAGRGSGQAEYANELINQADSSLPEQGPEFHNMEQLETNLELDKNLVPKTQTDQIASIYEEERYQISPVFTELLHNVYRSTWFRIKSPKDSVIFSPGETLVFSWETNIESPLYFDILNRHGQVVYRHENPVTSPWTYQPELEPAIYMYRFATEEQPVWMGVMVVVNVYIK